MAKSPTHRFGQIIGEALEAAIEPLLTRFAEEHHLYLDRKGKRLARQGNKVTWLDKNGNKHDLDFVLERGGSAEKIGTPVAFIEIAWRRYTKHSRNKAQEIQGAVIPLAETYESSAPFLEAVLAGVFTEGALAQLKSLGFSVVYFPYETIVTAFRGVGIVAAYDEDTPDAECAEKIRAWEALPKKKRASLARTLLKACERDMQDFMARLTGTVSRKVEVVRVLALHGTASELTSIEEAIRFVEGYKESDGSKAFAGYEIQVRYNNGDYIDGRFANKAAAVQFLATYRRA